MGEREKPGEKDGDVLLHKWEGGGVIGGAMEVMAGEEMNQEEQGKRRGAGGNGTARQKNGRREKNGREEGRGEQMRGD